MKVAGATALVTGGASGLGLATARSLAGSGADVIAVDLVRSLDRVSDEPGITWVPADVTDQQSVHDAVDMAARAGELRIVVSCAGIAETARIVGRTGPLDLASVRRMVDVNLVGAMTVLIESAQCMSRNEPDVEGGRGVIINAASIAAFDGQIGQMAYAASKGGVAAMTLPAARDLAMFGIRVCTIAPGAMDTPMLASMDPTAKAALADDVPFPARLGRPGDFAELVRMLVEHDYINGEVVRMDGGIRMPPR